MEPDDPTKPRTRGRGLEIGTLSATVAASYVGGALRRMFVTVDGVALLDLGCVKVVDDARLVHYRNQARALLIQDRELLVRSLIGIGQLQPGEDPEAAIAFTEFLYLPILEDKVWDGRDFDFPAEMSKRLSALIKARNLSFPSDTAFLMRKFIGLAGVFRAMRVHTINYRRAYIDYLDHHLAGADEIRRHVLTEFPELERLARGR